MDLLVDFGFALSQTEWPNIETKELEARNWPDEDGDDAFVPKRLKVQSTEISMTLLCRAEHDEAEQRYDALVEWFLGDGYGAKFRMRDMWHRRSAEDVYLKSVSEVEYAEDNEGEYLSLEISLHILNPLKTGWKGN